MTSNLSRALALGALLLLAACASENTIVLVPDPNGHVGRVVVTNAAGSQTLSQANTGTKIASRDQAPQPPVALSEETIRKTWGAALAAMPPQPRIFTLYFESGTSTLNADGLAQLATIVAEARQRDFPHLFIVGHADATGSDEVNIRISRERANVVADRLVRDGLDKATMAITSHGKRNPLVPTPDGVPEPRNRRVGVTVQ